MSTQRLVPVLFSILVIVIVALVQERYKTFAAVTATMPLTVTLALWITFAADDSPLARAQFAQGLLIGIVPTVLFIAAAWVMARRGQPFAVVVLGGYTTWGIALGAILAAKWWLR